MAKSSTQADVRKMEKDDKAIVKGKDQTNGDALAFKLDRDWAKSAFLIKDDLMGADKVGSSPNYDKVNRYWTSASSKFTDTRLGCNIGINPKPQFTRYSDIRVRGRMADRNKVSLSNTSGNYGMGRYYSEAIDDPAQIVYMKFGVPQFNSLTNFISKAFDPNMTILARTGRTPSIFFKAGQIAGTFIVATAFPIVVGAIWAGRAINWVFSRPTSKFYTLKPSMHLYWSSVGTLVNAIAINRGIFPRIMNVVNQGNSDTQKIGDPYKLDDEHLKALSELMPDVFTGGNFFDIYALANKAQRLANALYDSDYDKADNATATDFTGYVQKELTTEGTHTTYLTNKYGKTGILSAINRAFKLDNFWKSSEKDEKTEVNPAIDKNDPKGAEKKDKGWWQQYAEYFDAEFREGAAFATFRVDHTGQVQESFGNSVQESDISQKLNGISSQVRQARFSFADGNLAGDGVTGMVQGALGAVKDVALGALDGVTMGFSSALAGIAGAGYIDIPKHWQSSSASLPKSSYSMQLISPYGNAFSQMQNIYIPLAMILAGTLPLSTGKQSYTSPFLCQLFDRGRCQVRLGMIESLSISRGTSALAFNSRGTPLAIDVSFSVVDLSSIMHMPMSSGGITEIDMAIDEDNILSDYLAVLAGQDIYSQVYAMPKAKMRIAKALAASARVFSPAHWASVFHESTTSGMLQYPTLGMFNVLEAAVVGNDGAVGSKR